MSRSHLTAIREALESLNACHGRGQVHSVGLALDGRGWFTYTIPTSQYGRSAPSKRKFTILSKGDFITVFALGHQKTVNL
jgi:hypothetical protein